MYDDDDDDDDDDKDSLCTLLPFSSLLNQIQYSKEESP